MWRNCVLLGVLSLGLFDQSVWARSCTDSLTILRRAIDYSMAEQVVLVHGTSLQSLRTAVQAGRFAPGVLGADATQETEDYFYFYPAADRHEWPMNSDEFFDFDGHDGIPGFGAYSFASKYAAALAKTHEFLERIGKSPKDHEAYVMVRQYFEQPEVNSSLRVAIIETLGVSPEKFQEIERDLRSRRGIVLGFDPQVLQAFEALPGDAFDGDGSSSDIKIHVPNGLPLQYLRGLQAQSDQEHEELMQWLMSN